MQKHDGRSLNLDAGAVTAELEGSEPRVVEASVAPILDADEETDAAA
jgi:hypothetical protein